MKVISFFGSSSSGKTTIIENVIKTLSSGYKIMYIKGIPHENISLDTENKDTWRMENAGAYITYGLTPSRTYKMTREKSYIDDIMDENSDIVIIESFKSYKNAIKFLVIGDEEYIKNYEYNYIIRANNETYNGECIKYPVEFNKIIKIISGAV